MSKYRGSCALTASDNGVDSRSSAGFTSTGESARVCGKDEYDNLLRELLLSSSLKLIKNVSACYVEHVFLSYIRAGMKRFFRELSLDCIFEPCIRGELGRLFSLSGNGEIDGEGDPLDIIYITVYRNTRRGKKDIRKVGSEESCLFFRRHLIIWQIRQ